MSDIILIDFDAVYWRHWHTMKPEDAAEAPAYSTVRHVRELRAQCDQAIVCVDSPKCWRHELSPGYKSSRKEKPAHAGAQRANALRMLEEQGFKPIKVDGYEADDLIASATEWGVAQGHNVVIATMDKDLHQLVRPTRGSDDADSVGAVSILTLDKGEYRGVDYVRTRYGVGPELLGDWLALVGDSSDTIAGVPGIGDKTATKLLQAYGSILGCLDAARDQTTTMTPAGRSKLLDNQEQLALARRLVTLSSDVKAEWDKHMTSKESEGATMSEESYEEEAPESEERPATIPEAAKSESAVIVEQPRPKQTAALAVREQVTRPSEFALSLEPMTHGECKEVARILCDSRLFQQTFSTPQAVFSAIMLARSHGLGLMQVLMPGMVHNIKGKIAMSAQMIVGLVLRSGKAEYFDCVETTSQKAVFVTRRVGSKRETVLEFTIEEAKAAGYLSKPDSSWQKTPKTMLRHRCETELARLVYPDVVGGLYTPQEFEDAETRPERAA
jgi:5'-3' exonuclease